MDPIGPKKYRHFFVFFWFFMVFLALFGVLIIPKWLIKVPGPIAIVIGWFWELPKFWPNVDPHPSYLSPKYFKKYKKIWKHFRKILSFHIWTFWKSRFLTFMDPPNPWFYFLISRSHQKRSSFRRVCRFFCHRIILISGDPLFLQNAKS